jgi:hypothetical protein
MSRKLILLNVMLLALIAVVAWQLRVSYVRSIEAQKRFLARQTAVIPPPAVVFPPALPQTSASGFFQVAEQLLFSRDRNPTVIIEKPPPKPMPAFPRYYGMMNFGQGPRVILAAASGNPQKSYVVGDSIGEFKIKTIAPTGLEFEWDGKPVKASYAEMKDTQAQQAAAAGPAPSAGGGGPAAKSLSSEPAKPVTTATTVGGGNVSRPGIDLGGGYKGCTPGDTTPSGAVVDGYRKLITQTPFGGSCRWEKVQ